MPQHEEFFDHGVSLQLVVGEHEYNELDFTLPIDQRLQKLILLDFVTRVICNTK